MDNPDDLALVIGFRSTFFFTFSGPQMCSEKKKSSKHFSRPFGPETLCNCVVNLEKRVYQWVAMSLVVRIIPYFDLGNREVGADEASDVAT